MRFVCVERNHCSRGKGCLDYTSGKGFGMPRHAGCPQGPLWVGWYHYSLAMAIPKVLVQWMCVAALRRPLGAFLKTTNLSDQAVFVGVNAHPLVQFS